MYLNYPKSLTSVFHYLDHQFRPFICKAWKSLFTQLGFCFSCSICLTIHSHLVGTCCVSWRVSLVSFPLLHHPPLIWCLLPCLQLHTPSSPSPSYLRLCLVTWATGHSWPVLLYTLCWERAGWWLRRTIMRYGSHHGHLISPIHSLHVIHTSPWAEHDLLLWI